MNEFELLMLILIYMVFIVKLCNLFKKGLKVNAASFFILALSSPIIAIVSLATTMNHIAKFGYSLMIICLSMLTIILISLPEKLSNGDTKDLHENKSVTTDSETSN